MATWQRHDQTATDFSESHLVPTESVVHIVPGSTNTIVHRESKNKFIDFLTSSADCLWYPLVPMNTAKFITFLFWHSMVMTIGTPIARICRGHWMGVSSLAWLLNRIGVLRREIPFGDSLFVYRNTAGIDRSFALHAACGLLWLLVAFAQMVLVRRYKVVWHRKYGYAAIFVFFMHTAACLNVLFADEAKHHPLSKTLLMSAAFSSIIHMLRSIRGAVCGDVVGHEANSVVAFLYSIEGAGTIRTVQHLQLLFKSVLPSVFCGPGDCQAHHNGEAGQCVASYCVRLVLTRVMTYYWIGMYARYTKTRRGFVVSVLSESILTTSISAAFAMAIANCNLNVYSCYDADQGAAGHGIPLLSCWMVISLCALLRW